MLENIELSRAQDRAYIDALPKSSGCQANIVERVEGQYGFVYPECAPMTVFSGRMGAIL
jgi:hypothetical protein